MRIGRGLSQFELLVVAVIVLTAMALALPRLLRPRIAANEAAAIASLRSIQAAQRRYAEKYPLYGFAGDVVRLGPPPPGKLPDSNHSGLLEFVAGCPAQPCASNGYEFSIDQTSGAPVDTFRTIAVPQYRNRTGIRGFCADMNGRISYDAGGGTRCASPL